MNHCISAALLVVLSLCACVRAEDAKPVKALYISGGGYHDYAKLTPFLARNIARFAAITFDVKQGLKSAKDADFAKDYDVIFYNVCEQTDKNVDKELLENMMRVTKEGKPTVMVHCAMHCFRAGDEWADCCGLTTKAHDGFRGFTIKKANKDNAISKTLPDEFVTTGDELYQNIKFPETSTAVLTAFSVQSKKDHVVAWTQMYGKAKVFGTTLGHDMKTVSMDEYIKLLAYGTLWTVDKLGDDGKPKAGYEGSGKSADEVNAAPK